MSTHAQQEWQSWHEGRIAAAAAPYGPLALAGTHWLADYPEGRIPAVPGEWREDGDDLVLSAGAEDGPTVDGKPLTGDVRLQPDLGAVEDARVALGERRFVVLRREGLWAVRDFDPRTPLASRSGPSGRPGTTAAGRCPAPSGGTRTGRSG